MTSVLASIWVLAIFHFQSASLASSVLDSLCQYMASSSVSPTWCLLTATHGNWVSCGLRQNPWGTEEEVWPQDVWHAGPLACGHVLVPMNQTPNYVNIAPLTALWLSWDRTKATGANPNRESGAKPLRLVGWHNCYSPAAPTAKLVPNIMHSFGSHQWCWEGDPYKRASQDLYF